jgi:sugar phosphate isomerase/epimerase
MKTVLLSSIIALATATANAQTNPFFVFDNGLQGEHLKGIESKLDLVKETGFAGLSWRTDALDRVKQMLDGAKQRGLRCFAVYCNLELKDGRLVYDQRLQEIIALCQGTDTIIWPNITSKQFRNSDPTGDDIAVAGLRELADLCEANGLRIAIYPHVNMWVHRIEDAVRVARKVNRKNLGVTFNLCHALLDKAEERVPELIEEAAPHLFCVSINGADSGGGNAIQALGKGTYDVSIVLKKLNAVGYKGPIGLQCYNIKGDSYTLLTGSMAAWRKLNTGK